MATKKYKWYAAVRFKLSNRIGSPTAIFVWDKFKNKWIHTCMATPKPLAYTTARRKCIERKKLDKQVKGWIVIREDEYARNGFN